MEKIKEIILAAIPDAIFEEKQYLNVTVEPNKLHLLAETIRYNKDTQFDYLIQLNGVDLGDKLGVVYLLTASQKPTYYIVMKTFTEERENAQLYTVSDIWETANLNEREVFGLLGVRFINHPDMRRLFLRNSWTGYPLRKDYDTNPELNKLSLESKDESDTLTRLTFNNHEIIEVEENIFEKEEYVVNIGPQHPATHGVLHFRVSLDGEIVRKLDMNCGYIHRGIEKLSESLTYPQILHFTDRLDYLSAHINRHALCMCVEKALELEVPERAQYIRTIMDELTRIASHLLAWACICMDMGALTAFIYGMRDREKILDMFEETCGGRLITNYNVIGGVMADIHPNFKQKVKDFIPYMREKYKEYNKIFTGNVIAEQRMKGIGILSKEQAISFGVTGPSGRASGFHCDVRKIAPYAAYGKVKFEEVTRTEGDTYARYICRLEEVLESLNIIEQLIDNIPEGDFCAKTKAIIKLPEGEYFQRVEAARGEFGVYISSKGEKFPNRMKFRSPSMALVSVMDTLTRGEKIADLIAIGGSLDYVVPDIDR
jgi:NADH-quinone oxidoreductase subunit C/D